MNIPVEIEEAIRRAEMKHCAISTTSKTINLMLEAKSELEQEENKKKGLNRR